MGLYTYAHVFCGRRCDADVFAGIGYLLQLLSTLMKSIFFKAALPKKKKKSGFRAVEKPQQVKVLATNDLNSTSRINIVQHC